jgi:hypothetical protein
MLLPMELVRHILDWVPDVDPDIKRRVGLIKKIDINKFAEINKVCRVYSSTAKNAYTGLTAHIYTLPYYDMESTLWNVEGCLILNIVKRNNTVFGNSGISFSTLKTVCNCDAHKSANLCPLHICKAN